MASTNLEMLRMAAVRLTPVLDELVFVGGSTVELFITDEASLGIRETKDVDVIVEAFTYAEYMEFGERLKKIGFSEDTSDDAPLCRWVNDSTVLDVMPLDEKVLGFTNRWYKKAIQNVLEVHLAEHLPIKIPKPEYFLVTKIEAFNTRGKGDYYASHDLEDIIAVIDGRAEMIDDVKSGDEEVARAVTAFFKACLSDDRFLNALPGLLTSVSSDSGRLEVVLTRLRELAG
ncbi:MAG: hypothetical protein KF855_16280 [Acidobacteria bacterium]|nr:hypothetical protein [Acidobacteriota bacterium]